MTGDELELISPEVVVFVLFAICVLVAVVIVLVRSRL